MGTPLLSCSSYRYDGVTLVPRGSPPSTLYHNPTRFTLSYCRKSMVKMSINSPPINSIVLVAVALDFLVTVDSYPKPDDKIRSTTFQVQGGGNTGNAMPCAAHLGLTPRIISKVAGDSQGKRILNELEADGIDTSFIVSIDTTSTEPTCKTCKTSDVAKLHAKGIGAVCGWLLVGTAEKIPSSELVDTTGAGDAFVGAVLYSLCANFPPEKMLSFAAQVAAIGCRDLGARAGLPHPTDPRLSPFLA